MGKKETNRKAADMSAQDILIKGERKSSKDTVDWFDTYQIGERIKWGNLKKAGFLSLGNVLTHISYLNIPRQTACTHRNRISIARENWVLVFLFSLFLGGSFMSRFWVFHFSFFI